MLLGALLTITSIAILGLWAGGISGALVVGLAVGLSVSSGRLAFDSIVPTLQPDANYGRSFARLETFSTHLGLLTLTRHLHTSNDSASSCSPSLAEQAITYLLGNNSGTQPTEGILGLLKT